LGDQRKRRVVSLLTIWFQIDEARLRGYLDMTMPNLDGLDDSFNPIDWDSDSHGERYAWKTAWPLWGVYPTEDFLNPTSDVSTSIPNH
jgi:hypothetical protein